MGGKVAGAGSEGRCGQKHAGGVGTSRRWLGACHLYVPPLVLLEVVDYDLVSS